MRRSTLRAKTLKRFAMATKAHPLCLGKLRLKNSVCRNTGCSLRPWPPCAGPFDNKRRKKRMKTRDASSAKQALQRENGLVVNGDGVQPLILVFGCGGEFLGVQTQKFHNLGFNLVAQVDVLVQQGAHFFTALAQFFRAKGKP